MSTPCGHPRAGRVTTEPTGVREQGAHTPVCDLPACITEAEAWVRRVTSKPAYHVLDVAPQEVPA